MYSKEYLLIGSSSFYASANLVTEAKIVEVGNKLGAHIAVVNSKYSGTVNSGVPLVLPTSPYTSQAVVIPTSTEQRTYEVAFYAKAKPSAVGLPPRDLKEEEKRKIGTNAGMVPIAVVEGSPAYQADVLPGDILLEINGEKVLNSEDYGKKLSVMAPGKATFTFWRDGQRMEKIIDIRKVD